MSTSGRDIIKDAEEGNFAGVERCLEEDPQIVDHVDGRNALHWAVINGHADVVRLLLQARVNTDVQNSVSSSRSLYTTTYNHIDTHILSYPKYAVGLHRITLGSQRRAY